MSSKVHNYKLLEFLNQALAGGNVSIAEGIEISALLNYANNQSLLPLVANTLLNCNTFSRATTLELKSEVYSSLLVNEKIEKLIVTVVTALENNAICPILLKGASLSPLYKSPCIRSHGDIDLYVGEENYEKAIGILYEMADEKSRKCASFTPIHYAISIKNLPIEIHRFTTRMPNKRMTTAYRKFEREALALDSRDSIYVLEKKVNIPEPTFNLFYIFYHAWYHFVTGGVGLRQLCDIFFFIKNNHGKIDEKKLKEILTELNLMTQWKAFVFILVKYLGLDKDLAYFYQDSNKYLKKAEKIIPLILREGNFNHINKDTLDKTLRNACYTTFRYCKIFRIFPKAAIIYFIDNISIFRFRHFSKRSSL